MSVSHLSLLLNTSPDPDSTIGSDPDRLGIPPSTSSLEAKHSHSSGVAASTLCSSVDHWSAKPLSYLQRDATLGVFARAHGLVHRCDQGMNERD